MRTPKFSKRRRSPAPVIIIAVVVLLLGCWIFNMTCGGKEEVDTSAVTEYANRVRPIAEASTGVGLAWNSIVETLPQMIADPENLNEQLKNIEQQCKDLLDQAKALEVPEGMDLAHSAFLVCLEQRFRGTTNYRTDLVNALSAVDLEVYAQNITEDLQELVYSDGNYRFFKRAVTEVMDEKNISEVTLPDSIWIADWEQVAYKRVESFLVALKGTELHGMAIGTITLNPEGRIDEQDIHHLPACDEISVTVNIENQGNRTENEVAVSINLYSDTDPTPSRQEQAISSIGPGETVQVTFQGLRPTSGGVRNILEVKVEPVPQESFIENNQKLIYFTVE